MMLDSVQDYSRYVYSLQERHPHIQQLRLSLYTTGTTDGILKGEIHFPRHNPGPSKENRGA